MRRGGPKQLRPQIAREAARLMYEEGVKEYFKAKHMAAKRVLGKSAGKKQRHRPAGLPSNGEIQVPYCSMQSWLKARVAFVDWESCA